MEDGIIERFINFIKVRDINVKKTNFDGSAKAEALGLLYMTHFYENVSTLLSGRELSSIKKMNFSDYSFSWENKKRKLIIPKNIDVCLDLSSLSSSLLKDMRDKRNLKDTIDRRNKTNFVIIFLDIKDKKEDHANVLIYDKKEKILERFEPHGCNKNINDRFNYKSLNIALEKFCLQKKIKYKAPDIYLPEIGIQTVQEKEKKLMRNVLRGDPNGYCSVWCLYWIDLKFSFPELDSSSCIKIFMIIFQKYITNSNKNMTNYIRGYSEYLHRCGEIIYHSRVLPL